MLFDSMSKRSFGLSNVVSSTFVALDLVHDQRLVLSVH
jgi:hypothetical protein